NGEGEAVSGIAVARYGQNALEVIDNLKHKIAELSSDLPDGVSLRAAYDRSAPINRANDNLKQVLPEASFLATLVVILFLMHVRSALVAIIMLPVGMLIAMGAMHLMDINSNIMSLGGIAIAIGTMVDAAIVMIENAHKHLERAGPDASRAQLVIDACREVGP